MPALRRGDLGRMLGAWVVGTLALWIAGRLLPGLEAESPWSWAAAAAATAVLGALIRPILTVLAAAVGWLGVAAVALAGQAVVIQAALWVVPGIGDTSFWTTLAAAWISATVATVLVWLTTAGTQESLLLSLARSPGRRSPEDLPDPEVTGMLFVQLDGVAHPLLRWALQSGLMPTVRRWVDSGSHSLHEWVVQLPCTTPASQLGILHGTCAEVPAFRWYDRDLGRVLVANRPADARLIEDRAGPGPGLLADDGASVSNLFTGDAVSCSMVMSRAGFSRGSFATRRALAGFMARPDGLARSLNRAVAEIVRERYQARSQRRRDIVPRIVRPWQFTGLRAVTNGLLRDVNLAVVARELLAGRRSVYVDFVDYDEVAHHAGATRLESLAVLAELDRVVALLARLVELAPRAYEIVLLSDHGQSLGEPFESRYGTGLDAVCTELMGTDVAWVGEPVESWGRVGSLAEDAAAGHEGSQWLAGSVATQARRHQEGEPDPTPGEPVVLGSGNLGLIYAGGAERLTLEQLEARWPRLVAGLARHPGVTAVAGVSASDGPVALGAGGSVVLATGDVRGEDPLADLPAHAGAMLGAALRMRAAPDLYVTSVVDPGTAEVAAFEDLVGSHGGLGGWQDRGMVVAPAHLWRVTKPVAGAEALHRELVAMLERLGHRRNLVADDARAEADPGAGDGVSA